SIADAGAVNVIYGSGTGLTSSGNQFWNQNASQGGVDVQDAAESGDQFGAALTNGDFDGNGEADLAVGVPLEDGFNLAAETNFTDAGAVNVLYSSGTGLGAANNQSLSQASPSIIDSPETGDE